MSYCQRNNVTLVPEKTKLLAWSPKNQEDLTNLVKLDCPITIDNIDIDYGMSADHVGIVRSTEGNQSAILDRISAHRKALASVLYTGIAKGHRANPALGIRVEKMYATPVLLSGLSALVLTKKDIDTIDHHF